METALPGWVVLERSQWGSMLCQWLPQMARDARERRVEVVVVAFYGNMGARCTDGATMYQRYLTDLRAAVELWQARGTKVVLVAAPGHVGELADEWPVRRAVLQVAQENSARQVDGGTPTTSAPDGGGPAGAPREPVVLLGEPGDAAAPPLLVVSLRYARRLLQIGMQAT
jgi:hypothetical protein